jgi:6-phosphogluconolactonase
MGSIGLHFPSKNKIVNHIFATTEKLLAALADFLVTKARESIEGEGRFNLVLSGGSSPKKLYELLASEPYCDSIEWKKVYFFFGDERYVPRDHKDSNFLMTQGALFGPLSIAEHQIFEVNTALSPSAAAADYEQRIRQHFGGYVCRFDVILLGLGDNSHTASLFPHTSVLHEKKAMVKEVFVEEVNMYRITFTTPLINAAHTVVFLVFGVTKAAAVFHILKDPVNIEEYPAQLIHPESGDLHWFMDEAAASLI